MPAPSLGVGGCSAILFLHCKPQTGGCSPWPHGGLASGRDCFLRAFLKAVPSQPGPGPRSQNHWPQEDLKIISSIPLNLLQKSSHRESLSQFVGNSEIKLKSPNSVFFFFCYIFLFSTVSITVKWGLIYLCLTKLLVKRIMIPNISCMS